MQLGGILATVRYCKILKHCCV